MVDVPIPYRMKHLMRDHRGYAIPWAVFIDDNGKPHLTINDDKKRYFCLTRDRCPICADRLLRGRWFVGGPLSAFHPKGAFADPPMHFECMRYSLQACPYLAAPYYARRIDDKTLDKADSSLLLIDDTMIERRPTVFIAVLARGHRIAKSRILPNAVPLKPYIKVEYWQHGVQLDNAAGEALIEVDRMKWKSLVEGQVPPRILGLSPPESHRNDTEEITLLEDGVNGFHLLPTRSGRGQT